MTTTTITIDGEPRASFCFFDIPNWNAYASKQGWSQRDVKRKWFDEGEKMAFLFKQNLPKYLKKMLVVNRAFVHIRVFIPFEEVSDSHNVYFKAIFDGFSQAKLWAGDDWAHVPIVLITWAGIDPNPEYRYGKPYKSGKMRPIIKRRTVFEIHELGAFVINGEFQLLPLGRSLKGEINWTLWEAIGDCE